VNLSLLIANGKVAKEPFQSSNRAAIKRVSQK